jgi:hypothetical protein
VSDPLPWSPARRVSLVLAVPGEALERRAHADGLARLVERRLPVRSDLTVPPRPLVILRPMFSTDRNLLPVLMVWVVLLCHGFLSLVHLPASCHGCDAPDLLSAPPAYGPAMVMGASAGGDPAVPPGRAEGGGILAMFGALLLALIAAIRRPTGFMFSRSFRPRPSPVIFYRPRGPTHTSLQVLRL